MNFDFGRSGPVALLLLGLWLWAGGARAQVPAWVLATAGSSGSASSSSTMQAVATDAAGNVFVTGAFSGTLVLGSTTLLSAGLTDFFVAKYVPATATWAWAVRGGGTGNDYGYGLAVSGSSVYLTGYLVNNRANASQVLLGTTPQYGAASGYISADLLVAKYTDLGATASLAWAQVGGGWGNDYGYSIAVRGAAVYVAGFITNDAANTYGTVFGGSGSVAGTLPQAGVSTAGASADIVVAKYLDQGTTALVSWTQVGGGTGDDYGKDIAVSTSGVYVVGTLANNKLNANNVLFGGTGLATGTSPQYGASSTTSNDLVLAKYTDNGPSATLGWTQVGGGTSSDLGAAVAAQENLVYITGYTINDRSNTAQVVFGGAGLAAGTSPQYGASNVTSNDLVLAKYTDNGPSAALGWTQVGGGTSGDSGIDLAVDGNTVYVAGYFTNNLANGNTVLFGGTGAAAGTSSQLGVTTAYSSEVLVVSYADQGTSASINWTRAAGGVLNDAGHGLAMAGTRLYVAGYVYPAAAFGSLTIGTASSSFVGFLGCLSLAGPLATAPAAASPLPRLYPNPAVGPATLSGASAGAAVSIFDALGRRVATATADARGTAALPGGLHPGVYVVRAGTSTARWVVE